MTEIEELILEMEQSRQALEIELKLWERECQRRSVQLRDGLGGCLVDRDGRVNSKLNLTVYPDMSRGLNLDDLRVLHVALSKELQAVIAALSPNVPPADVRLQPNS